jgi:hypothetical protein
MAFLLERLNYVLFGIRPQQEEVILEDQEVSYNLRVEPTIHLSLYRLSINHLCPYDFNSTNLEQFTKQFFLCIRTSFVLNNINYKNISHHGQYYFHVKQP